MVLFIYISRLASNEIFNISIKRTLISTVLIIVITIAATLMLNNQLTTQTSLGVRKRFRRVYSSSIILPSAVTILYLLLTLIVVVKITSKYEGPIRRLIFTR
jgi:NADH-ubiquinone oxidoreductase chain 6